MWGPAMLLRLAREEEAMAKIRLKEYQCEPYFTFRTMYLEDQFSIATIAEKMGCSISKVQKYLEHEGLTRTNLESKRLLSKRTQHNSTFFDSIDAEEKAYWLGFFYADGYLDKDGSTLKLDLSARDTVHLQRFASIFHREVRVYERNPDKRNGRVYSTASCTISCAYLWHALIEKGIKQGNTLSEDTSVFEHIPDELLVHHFVRGFFDGDGSVHRGKRGSLQFSFVGSFSFLEHLRRIIVASAGLPAPKLETNRRLACIRWSGNGSSERFKRWLYLDATIWLERKRNVFDS
jgi:DNA-binding transcriptional regulator WhiA